LLVRKLIFPRGHASPTDAVFYFPKRLALQIVLHAISSQLRRAGILALGYGRRRRVSFCCAVANRAVFLVELRKLLNIGGQKAQPETNASRLSDAELIQQLADQAKQLGIEIDLNYRFASDE
jgi:hypothetical protein